MKTANEEKERLELEIQEHLKQTSTWNDEKQRHEFEREENLKQISDWSSEKERIELLHLKLIEKYTTLEEKHERLHERAQEYHLQQEEWKRLCKSDDQIVVFFLKIMKNFLPATFFASFNRREIPSSSGIKTLISFVRVL